MVAPSMMTATAGKTGHFPPRQPDALVALPASRTAEPVTAYHTAALEGKLMSPPLAGNPEIAASLSPLPTVGLQTTATMTVLREQMGQLMAKRFLDLLLGNFAQGGIEPDLPAGGNCHSSRRPHAGIPANDKLRGEFGSQGMNQRARTAFKFGIPLPGTLPGKGRMSPFLRTAKEEPQAFDHVRFWRSRTRKRAAKAASISSSFV